MNDFQINDLLQALPAKILKQFAKTLKEDSVTFRLFQCLRPDEGKSYTDSKKMAKYVFKTDRKEHNKALGNEASKLYNLLGKWLAMQEVASDELLSQELFARSLKRLKLNDLHLKALDKIDKQLEQRIERDAQYHLHQIQLFHARYFNSGTDFLSENAAAYFKQAVNHLEAFHTIAQLRYIMENNTRNLVFKKDHELRHQTALLAADHKDNIVARLYALAARLIHEPVDELFNDEFCPLLEDNITLASEESQSALATFRINYCIMRTQSGEADFFAEQYKAYNFALKNKYIGSGRLHPDHYLNMILASSALGHSDEATKMLKKAKDWLGPDAKNTSSFAEAYTCFYQKNISKAKELLKSIDFENFNYKLRYRSLEAQCNYEQFLLDDNKADQLFYCLNNYEKFIRRKEESIDPRTWRANLNFIKILKKISGHLQENRTELLRDFLDKENLIILKTWLRSLMKT